MPRGNRTPLIQKIAKQASVTFKDLNSSGSIADRQAELVPLVTTLRAADLRISGPIGGAPEPQTSPPVTYMHICETELFSMGVFLLRSGASIPLHDHPDMCGMLKVLYGTVRVRCFDKVEENIGDSSVIPDFDPPFSPLETDSLWRSILRSVCEYSENSEPCLLTPLRDNLHQIDAVDGPAAFLDILAPPYNPDDGRDCRYYKVLKTVADKQVDGKSVEAPGEDKAKEKKEEAWLLEVPQPEDFWCGGEVYPGPVVSI